MIYIVVAYVIFLLIFLPLNFYIVFRVHEMGLVHDHTSTAITFLAAGIAVMLLISLVTIAAFDWPTTFSILKEVVR